MEIPTALLIMLGVPTVVILLVPGIRATMVTAAICMGLVVVFLILMTTSRSDLIPIGAIGWSIALVTTLSVVVATFVKLLLWSWWSGRTARNK